MKNFRFSHRPFSRLLAGLLCAALCAGLALSATACAQKTPQYEAQPGVTYTQLMSAMNQQLNVLLSQQLDHIALWRMVHGRVLAYGSYHDPAAPENDRDHLLADVATDGSGYSCIQLQLPELTAATPDLAAALQAQAAGATPDYDIAAGYDLPDRSVVGVAENANGDLYLVLDDNLCHWSTDAAGMPQGSVTERQLTLCNLGKDGAVQPVAALQLPAELAALQHVGDAMFFDEAGGLWLSIADPMVGQGHLLRYALDGSLQATLSLPEGISLTQNGVVPLPDDRLAVLGTELVIEGGYRVCGFYLAAGLTTEQPAWSGDAIPLPAALTNTPSVGFVADVTGLSETVQLQTVEGVYTWQVGAPEVTQALAWNEYGINAMGLQAAFALEGGQYLAACLTNGNYTLQVLTPLDPAVVAGREVITFAKLPYGNSIAFNAIEDIINRFNTSNTQYYVRVVEYTNEIAEQRGYDYYSGLANGMLLDDLAAGNAPDVVMLSSIPETWLNKGLLVNLYPYLDADPTLAREDFFPGLLACTQWEATLPTVMAAYSVQTLVCDPALVGPDTGWTLEEFSALCAEHPNMSPVFNRPRSYTFQLMVEAGGSDFIDWETRQAHLDTPAFVELLQTSKNFPEEGAANMDPRPVVENGEMLSMAVWYEEWPSVNECHYALGDDYIFKGYPSQDGGSGVAVPLLQLGITNTCKNPEAAWQLLRMFLLPEFQDHLGSDNYTYRGFPLRKDSLAVSLQAAQQPLAFTSSRSVPGFLNIDRNDKAWDEWADYFCRSLTAQDAQKLQTLIENLRGRTKMDDTVSEIIWEETDAFYNGQRTAEEAAKIIQDRVQTYLDEQA